MALALVPGSLTFHFCSHLGRAWEQGYSCSTMVDSFQVGWFTIWSVMVYYMFLQETIFGNAPSIHSRVYTFVGLYFDFCQELALETCSLQVHDLDHTHSLVGIQ